MAAVRDEHLLGTRDAGGDVLRARRAADEVVLAGDHERRRLDRREVSAQVPLRNPFVEQLQRKRVPALADERLVDVLRGALVERPEVHRPEAARDRVELGVVRVVAGVLLLERPQCVVVPRPVAMPRPQLLLLLELQADEGVGRDQPADPLGMRCRVRERDDAAVRVAEQVELLDAEVLTQLLDVRDVVGRRVRARVLRRVGVGGAARIEHDERARRAEAAQVREVARREAGPARMAHQERPRTLPATGQPAPVVRTERFLHARFPSTTRSRPVRSTLILTR